MSIKTKVKPINIKQITAYHPTYFEIGDITFKSEVHDSYH